MTARFQDKDPGDIIVVDFDFSPDAQAVAADPAPTISVTVAAGADTDPSAILLGTVTIDGAHVYQRVTGGLTGVDYAMKCTAVIGADRMTIEAILPVRLRPVTVQASAQYCSEAEFEQRFGEREMRDLLADGASYLRAENDAASTVDGFLASRYATPIATPPALVVGWTADITRYRLWDDHSPEEVRRRYEAALAQLRDLARGIISLPATALTEAPTSAGLAFESYGNTRVFTESLLRGY